MAELGIDADQGRLEGKGRRSAHVIYRTSA